MYYIVYDTSFKMFPDIQKIKQLFSQFPNEQTISHRIVFYYSLLELFHVLSGAIFIFLQFDWLNVSSALLMRQ